MLIKCNSYENTIYPIREKGYNTIVGEHILTSKNGMVVDHFKNLGFRSSGNKWELKVNNYKEKKCHIKII